MNRNFRNAGLGMSAAAMMFCAFAFIQGDEKVTLRIALQKGQSYVSDFKTQMTAEAMGQVMQAQTDLGSIMTATDVQKNDQHIDFSYTSFKMQMPTTPGMIDKNFDSGNMDPKSPSTAQYKRIAASKVSIVLTPAGKVNGILGLKEATKKAKGDHTVMSEMFNIETFRTKVEQRFNYLPEKPVGVGDSWTKAEPLESQMPTKDLKTYRVKSITNDKVILDVNGVVESDSSIVAVPGSRGLVISGTSVGTIELDKATGFITSSQVNTTVTVTKDGAEFMKFNMSSNLTGKVK